MLGEALRTMRVFHDLKQNELAPKLGIAKSYLSEIEAGKKMPTLQLLERYAELFAIPVSSILFFSENFESDKPEEQARNFVSSKILAIMRFIAERSGSRYAD